MWGWTVRTEETELLRGRLALAEERLSLRKEREEERETVRDRDREKERQRRRQKGVSGFEGLDL